MSVLRVERDGAVAILTLARPAAGNALNLDLARALRDAVVEVAADTGVAAVVIAAEGTLFCSGGDLGAMHAAESPTGYVKELADTMHSALAALVESDKVVIGAVNGAVAGGGLGLVLACDHVIAADTATFVSAYSAVALSPDCGTSFLLPLVTGQTRARSFFLTAQVLTAETANLWGVVNEVVPGGEIASVVARVAARAARLPASARVKTKQLLTAGWAADYRAHLDAESAAIAELAGSEESEVLRSGFLAKAR